MPKQSKTFSEKNKQMVTKQFSLTKLSNVSTETSQKFTLISLEKVHAVLYPGTRKP